MDWIYPSQQTFPPRSPGTAPLFPDFFCPFLCDTLNLNKLFLDYYVATRKN
jgi:hypothetical protein